MWFPRSADRAAVLAVVILMVILHQSELLGLMDAGLLFGWLPVQLAYDFAFLFVGSIIVYWITTVVAATPDKSGSTDQTEESVTADPSTTTET